MKYFPLDTQKKENYAELYAPIWANRPELKQDALNAIFASDDIGYNPLTRLLSKFPKLVLQDGYEWEWHENGNTMCDQLGLCRVVIPMTGMANNKQVAMDIEGKYGMYKIWADTIQLALFKEFAWRKKFLLMFGKSATHHMDADGKPVRYVAGLLEKLEGSNIEIYNRPTARMLYDFIADAMKGNINLNQHRNIVCYTGTWGMQEIRRALREELLKTTGGIVLGEHFVSNASSNKYNPNSLVFGGQFTEYHLPINVTLRVEWMPLYDDTRLNSDIDPMTGHPIESMRMTFLDLTEIDGEPNVQLVEHKNGLMFNPVAGTIDPYDPTPMGQAAHTDSYFNYVMEENIGIHIRDISRCGELIYAVQ